MSLATDGQDPTAGWRLWESTPGYGERRRYYATRIGSDLPYDRLGGEVALTVWGDTPDERMVRLLQQQALCPQPNPDGGKTPQ